MRLCFFPQRRIKDGQAAIAEGQEGGAHPDVGQVLYVLELPQGKRGRERPGLADHDCRDLGAHRHQEPGFKTSTL